MTKIVLVTDKQKNGQKGRNQSFPLSLKEKYKKIYNSVNQY